ncbi:MAG: YeaH/YhbH family protein [Rhodocyclales bacterium]|nr:YeaH/YhbH family protein [Rhodocyclales bacterium]
MVRIVDRRFDSKNKSAVNRSRFIRRFKGHIRGAVQEAIARRGIRDIDSGEKIGIPARDISEPQFRHGRAGIWRQINAGNDRFQSGDEIERPPGGAGRGSGGSPEGESIDDFVFTLSREEFLDLFFDELALPNLVKTQLARIDEYKRVRAGHTQSGVPANISIRRSLRGAAGRRVAFAGPLQRRIAELEKRLAELLATATELDPEVKKIRREIAQLKARIDAIPFIDSFDLRYNNRVRIPQPSTQAVMFCLMDVSGSMDEAKKQIAKRFFMLLYLFLTRTYRHIDVVFIRHHTQADEVDEDDFFHSRESGGTVVSSALDLTLKVIGERFASSVWNIYIAQASDGDNWESDSPRCRALLENRLLPLCQYFAYIEIAQGDPQNLWREYERLRDTYQERFAMQRIEGPPDIYPVFRSLFRKKLA